MDETTATLVVGLSTSAVAAITVIFHTAKDVRIRRLDRAAELERQQVQTAAERAKVGSERIWEMRRLFYSDVLQEVASLSGGLALPDKRRWGPLAAQAAVLAGPRVAGLCDSLYGWAIVSERPTVEVIKQTVRVSQELPVAIRADLAVVEQGRTSLEDEPQPSPDAQAPSVPNQT